MSTVPLKVSKNQVHPYRDARRVAAKVLPKHLRRALSYILASLHDFVVADAIAHKGATDETTDSFLVSERWWIGQDGIHIALSMDGEVGMMMYISFTPSMLIVDIKHPRLPSSVQGEMEVTDASADYIVDQIDAVIAAS